MTALKKQVNDLVAQIYGKSGRESMAEITSQVDFMSDNGGQSIRVVTQPGLKNFSDMSVTPKEVELLRNQSPKVAEMLTGKIPLEDLTKKDDGDKATEAKQDSNTEHKEPAKDSTLPEQYPNPPPPAAEKTDGAKEAATETAQTHAASLIKPPQTPLITKATGLSQTAEVSEDPQVASLSQALAEQQNKMDSVSNEIQMLTQQLKEAGLFGQKEVKPVEPVKPVEVTKEVKLVPEKKEEPAVTAKDVAKGAAAIPTTIDLNPAPPAGEKPAQPDQNIPTKPQEATILESAIKTNKKKLLEIQEKPYVDLETEEQLRSTYEDRMPRSPKELINEELERVRKEKNELKQEIKLDEDRLEEIYPERVRIVVKEQERLNLEKAIGAMANGGCSSPEQATMVSDLLKAKMSREDQEKNELREMNEALKA